MQPKEYDLLAIGGGTAGLVSTAGAAYLGVRAALVEKSVRGAHAEERDAHVLTRSR
jgi:succinate dehydrogenase/fumarate reductase flavoprotein subunit